MKVDDAVYVFIRNSSNSNRTERDEKGSTKKKFFKGNGFPNHGLYGILPIFSPISLLIFFPEDVSLTADAVIWELVMIVIHSFICSVE